MNSPNSSLSRRALLRYASLAATTTAASSVLARAGLTAADRLREDDLRIIPPSDRKLLFVFCAYGGASIIDSFMPVADTEVPDIFVAPTLNNFPASMVEKKPGSNIRNVGVLPEYGLYEKPLLTMGDFVARHKDDMAVIAHNVSSVNHTVGQQRSLNGAGVNRGRTLMESHALRYGGGLPLPNINMASDGYARHGVDMSVPLAARHELIAAPLLFGTATHGYNSTGVALDAEAFARARAARNELDRRSLFARTFAHDSRLEAYLNTRNTRVPEIEKASLIDRLLLLDASQADSRFGIKTDAITQTVRASLPKLNEDRLEAQVALAFLAAYHGVSASITLGFPTDPYIDAAGSIVSAPIAFDFSHASHRAVQNVMWNRTVSLLDALISMLKTHDYLGDPTLGKMWDRSLVYVATEFGRDKQRPAFASDWSTGHNLNNGSLLVSPLLKGNAVYGGVAPLTCETFGCDINTGAPTPDRSLTTEDLYGIIAHALDLDSPSTPKYPAIVRT